MLRTRTSFSGCSSETSIKGDGGCSNTPEPVSCSMVSSCQKTSIERSVMRRGSLSGRMQRHKPGDRLGQGDARLLLRVVGRDDVHADHVDVAVGRERGRQMV